jgi:hypothetical protein
MRFSYISLGQIKKWPIAWSFTFTDNDLCYTKNKMKVYLDNCALNRPFDDQSQERIRIETEAVVLVLSHLERMGLAWKSGFGH